MAIEVFPVTPSFVAEVGNVDLTRALSDDDWRAIEAAFDAAVLAQVQAVRPEVVCLAGFMRILGPAFVNAFPDRIVNTHPSLLPAFPGTHAVREALAYGVRVTGCTVHLGDEQVDHGPVLFQAAVAVEDGDDEASLHERIKREEHRLLPAAVRLLAHGRVRVEGRSVRLLPEPARLGRASLEGAQ